MDLDWDESCGKLKPPTRRLSVSLRNRTQQGQQQQLDDSFESVEQDESSFLFSPKNKASEDLSKTKPLVAGEGNEINSRTNSRKRRRNADIFVDNVDRFEQKLLSCLDTQQGGVEVQSVGKFLEIFQGVELPEDRALCCMSLLESSLKVQQNFCSKENSLGLKTLKSWMKELAKELVLVKKKKKKKQQVVENEIDLLKECFRMPQELLKILLDVLLVLPITFDHMYTSGIAAQTNKLSNALQDLLQKEKGDLIKQKTFLSPCVSLSSTVFRRFSEIAKKEGGKGKQQQGSEACASSSSLNSLNSSNNNNNNKLGAIFEQNSSKTQINKNITPTENKDNDLNRVDVDRSKWNKLLKSHSSTSLGQDSSSQPAQDFFQSNPKPKRKRITWGDTLIPKTISDPEKKKDSSCSFSSKKDKGKIYGGWGLEKVVEIENALNKEQDALSKAFTAKDNKSLSQDRTTREEDLKARAMEILNKDKDREALSANI